jgi:hypothetical protein
MVRRNTRASLRNESVAAAIVRESSGRRENERGESGDCKESHACLPALTVSIAQIRQVPFCSVNLRTDDTPECAATDDRTLPLWARKPPADWSYVTRTSPALRPSILGRTLVKVIRPKYCSRLRTAFRTESDARRQVHIGVVIASNAAAVSSVVGA